METLKIETIITYDLNAMVYETKQLIRERPEMAEDMDTLRQYIINWVIDCYFNYDDPALYGFGQKQDDEIVNKIIAQLDR